MPFPRFISLAKTTRRWSYLSCKVFQTPKDTKCIVHPPFIAFGTTYQIKAIKYPAQRKIFFDKLHFLDLKLPTHFYALFIQIFIPSNEILLNSGQCQSLEGLQVGKEVH